MNDAARYPSLTSNPDFPALETEVLAFWQREAVFEASVERRPRQLDGKPNSFVFYDGPPFANGLPHYGHLLTGYVKDLVARYQTMRGKRVERRFGWDCHGLPAEMAAEKELNISGRQQITEYGIGTFNEYCRTNVMRYADEWKRYVDRQARWVDMADDYKTMDRDFMESVLWAFKQLYDKGYVYESYRVLAYSWGAETPLSNFETRLDNATREKTDKAVTVAFELTERPAGAPEGCAHYYVLAWTTTPWTLPSNLALAASSQLDYLPVVKDGDCYIIATDALSAYQKELGSPEEEALRDIAETRFNGTELIGLSYQPLFPFFKDHPHSFRILDGSDFIEAGSGTGIVHMAPGFGEDDQRVCEANGIAIVCPVDDKGRYTAEIYDLSGLTLQGLNVIAETNGKSSDEPYTEAQLAKYGLANLRIIQWLKEQGRLIKQDDYTHNYPHCWRTDTPLIYRAMPSWYIRVTDFKDRAAELNQRINWVPGHVRDGQMGHMLKTAPDWSISRNRFWGCPIPIWKSDNPENKQLYVFGSIAELQDFFGVEVADLHRPYIDELTAPDPLDPRYTLRRVEDVFDCWFESGSMPFAQLHYPFENREAFEQNFPADFITEYIAQTRGWFNTLIMIAAGVFDSEPFKNCICHGVVIDEETGLKYSKRLKNYKDPMEVFDKFGADALRWLMVASPVMRGQDLAVDPEGRFIRDVVRLYIKPLWNAYHFFCLYANADKVTAEFRTDSDNAMDRYILAKCREMLRQVQTGLDGYDTPSACAAISQFVEVLNNWYIRRNRHRFWKSEQDADKMGAYHTLYTVLHCITRAAAPLLPFTTEAIFAGLVNGGVYARDMSVHLQDFPQELEQAALEAGDVLYDMDRVRELCNAAHAIRNQENIRVRQPLLRLTCYQPRLQANLDYYRSLIADEVNVKEVVFSEELETVASLKLKIHFPIAGKRLGGKMKEVGTAAKSGQWERRTDGAVIVAGEALLPEEYGLQLEAKEARGAQALSAQDGLVVLDLTIDEALLREGIARDVVRLVQQARKEADLDISDRIRLAIRADETVSSAIDQHRGYIAEQTLASEIALTGDVTASLYTAQSELDGQEITIGLSKAAA